jgi:hypothetical protein
MKKNKCISKNIAQAGFMYYNKGTAARRCSNQPEKNMTKQITIKEATSIASKVHASVNRASDPRNVDWNDRIDALLADLGLGWKLRQGTYIDGLDCQFIGSLAKTIRANAVAKFEGAR